MKLTERSDATQSAIRKAVKSGAALGGLLAALSAQANETADDGLTGDI